MKSKLLYEKITNIDFADVDYNDRPDFCDAYICSADYDGKPMDEEQLIEINEDEDFVHEKLLEWL